MAGQKIFQIRVDNEEGMAFLKTIDDWRRKQPDLPPRSEAVRRLVQLGAAAPSAAHIPAKRPRRKA